MIPWLIRTATRSGRTLSSWSSPAMVIPSLTSRAWPFRRICIGWTCTVFQGSSVCGYRYSSTGEREGSIPSHPPAPKAQGLCDHRDQPCSQGQVSDSGGVHPRRPRDIRGGLQSSFTPGSEEVDDHIVVPDPATAVGINPVHHLHDLFHPHIDPALLPDLACHRLPQPLATPHCPSRQAPETPTRFPPATHQQHLASLHHDGTDSHNGTGGIRAAHRSGRGERGGHVRSKSLQ